MSTNTRLIGIYQAEGTLLGELRYFIGKLRGTSNCALCEISHRGLRTKTAFKKLQQNLPYPLEMLHLNELSVELKQIVLGKTPCIVKDDLKGYEIFLATNEIIACRGQVSLLQTKLIDKINSLPAK